MSPFREANRPTHIAAALSGLSVAVCGLLLVSHYAGFLIFHCLVESINITIAGVIFAVFWNTRRIIGNDGFFTFLGAGYLAMAVINGLHMFAFRGMGVFYDSTPNTATQLWIAAQTIETFTLLAGIVTIHRPVRTNLVIAGYGSAVLIACLTIFLWKCFPTCYVEGQGLTPFKRYAEYSFAALVAFTSLMLFHQRRHFPTSVFLPLLFALFMYIGAELMFTVYVNVYGDAITIGHLLKLVSILLIYRALIEVGLRHPYQLMFHNLTLSRDALRKANRDLEQRVHTRTAELEDFGYAIAHNLNQPLRGVSGLINILREDHIDKRNTDAMALVDRIEHAATRMAAQIDALLELSQISRRNVECQNVSLSDLAEEIVAKLRHTYPHHPVSISIEPNIRTDCDTRIATDVLTALLDNAWRFTQDVSSPRVSFGEATTTHERLFFVRDNGIGFDMPLAEKKLFHPFERLHNLPDREGNGIGLAMAKRLLTLHDGHIWAEGKLGCGAAFFFSLPCRCHRDDPLDDTETVLRDLELAETNA